MLGLPEIIRYGFGDAEFALIMPNSEAPEQESEESGTLHCHRYYEIHCNTGKRRVLELPTGQVHLETDQFLLICPGCMHYAVPYQRDARVMSFELRQGKGEEGFYRYFLGLLNGLNLKPLPVSRKLKASLEELTSAGKENTVMVFCRLKLLGLTALVSLLEAMAAASEEADTAYTPEHTGAFDAALDMMLYSELSLGQIARQLGYSERHTARLIRRRYGESLGRIRRKAANEEEGKE